MGTNLFEEGWLTGFLKARISANHGPRRNVLSQEPERIDNKLLEQFPEFIAFKEGSVGTDNNGDSNTPAPLPTSKTPFAVLEDAYAQIQSALARERPS
jgi:restriction system protein